MTDPARRRIGSIAGLVLGLCVAVPALAADAASAGRPIVAGFERFGAKSDPTESGLLLLGELSCTACHRAEGGVAAHIDRKQAPILDGVGSRVRPAYLRSFLADPRGVKPGTTMPDLFHGWPAAEKAGAVEALTHLLASTGRLAHARPTRKAVDAGRTLYHRVGCVACHGPRGEGATTAGDAVPLGDLAAKYTVPGLAAFLLDPLKSRPSGRMPGSGLKAQEASEVAQFLLKDVRLDPRPNLAYRYYEGSWEKLPDLARLKPAATGEAEGLDLGVARRADDVAIRFEGFLRIDREGPYVFHLRSDDGGKLFLDDKLVVDNDGVHPAQDKRGSARLARGPHRLAVEYFNGGGEAELEVEFQGPGLGRRDVSDYLSLTEGPPAKADDPDRLAVDPALVARGRDLFARVGCASCHQLNADGKAIVARSEARPLATLADSSGGCLADKSVKYVPYYNLSKSQANALSTALKGVATLGARGPTHSESIARTMTALNCYACHRRGDAGGVEASRDASFATTQKEMGDEGRLPPRLDGVGAKLNMDYLQHVLADGEKDRPYMLTRMPRFGPAVAGPLARAFAAVDAVGPAGAVAFEETPKRVKSAGRSLVGGEGLSCVKCHTFKGNEAEGIQAIDMTRMTRRLRRDWFHRYVVDPPAFRPGTRMPTAWPGGKSTLPAVLGGDASRQVEAVWRYLADGTAAAEPSGMGRQPMPLYAIGGAVIYRNFIRGAGPRAIGVGYPERANLAFDANDLRLALIWQGGFIDASRHWSGRGDGFQPPMGDNVVSLPEGAPFARLPSPSSPWPGEHSRALGYKFRGYRLAKDGRPTFLYDLGAARVEDRPDAFAASGQTAPGLKRMLTLTSDRPPEDLWLRAAVGQKIERLADGRFLVDGEWKVRLEGGDAPIVRESGGKKELIVPVKFAGGAATVAEQFEW